MPKFSKKAKEVITRELPDGLIKQRSAGRSGNLSYISGSTVIDLLNEAFGYLWNWEAQREWMQESVEKFNPKYDKEPVPQNPVAHVMGILTVYLPQDDGTTLEIRKTGYGSKSVIGGQSEQESVFKAAGTDAMKKAASLFGIGLELYRDEEEQEFFEMNNYEDPWTDEALEATKEERAYITSFMQENELGDEEMAYYYEQFSGGEYDDISGIVPETIGSFVQFLKDQLAAVQEGA